MDKDEALYYQLEDYLDGKLPEKEREKLQSRIATDEQVAEQLALVRLERELAGLMADDELEAKMQQWAEEAETRRKEEENGLGQEGKKERLGLRWLAGLSIVAAALVAGYWLFSPDTPAPPKRPSGEERAGEAPRQESAPPPVSDTPEEKTEPSRQQQPERQNPLRPSSSTQSPPVASERPTRTEMAQQLALALAETTSPIEHTGARNAERRSADKEESPLDKGFRQMGENNLTEARQTLEAIPPEPRGVYRNARQYLAYIYFEQGDYNAAIPIFKELISISYADAGKMKWYLALAYLSTGDTGKGLPLAREVAASDKEKKAQEAAVKLLEDLGEK
ncbi:MAG: hypothetical protein J5I98_20200 [Phaeodactylibacter sp.]|nr:hypothetical protein [Phaeodactylibacter sp.]